MNNTSTKVHTDNLINLHTRVQNGGPTYIERFLNVNGRLQYRWMKVRSSEVLDNGTVSLHCNSEEASPSTHTAAGSQRLRYRVSLPRRS